MRSEEVEGRRVFQLTDAGQREVDRRGKEAPPPWELSEDAGPLVDLREIGFGVAAAVFQVAQTGSARQVARAREILAETRRRLYGLLAEDEAAGDEPDEGDATE